GAEAQADTPAANGKLVQARNLLKLEEELNRQDAFSSFKVLVTDFPFHDRFFYCTDDDKDGLLLASGSSMNQFLQKYASLIRIENRSFRRRVARFVRMAGINSVSLAQY